MKLPLAESLAFVFVRLFTLPRRVSQQRSRADPQPPMTQWRRDSESRVPRAAWARHAPRLEEIEPRLAPAVFTVTSPLDVADPDDAMLSLREAILLANADADQDTIRFSLAEPAPIVLASAIPTITHSVILDGWSQNGSSAPSTPTVELSGANLTGNESGLVIAASDTQVNGLVIRDFGGYGIVIDGGAGDSVRHVTVQGNRIGTDRLGEERHPNQLGGILVLNASDNVIGGTSPSLGNLVSGNDGVGITLVGAGQILIDPQTDSEIETLLAGGGNQNTTTRNRIIGNVIGLAASGNSPLGNRGHGVWLERAGGNWIGGPNAGEGNTISGNGRAVGTGGQATDLDPQTAADGIRMTGSAVDSQNPQAACEAAWNRIQGNRIGTDPTGSSSFNAGGVAWLGNTGDGIRLGDLSLRLAQREASSAVPLYAGPRHTLVGVLPTVGIGGANTVGGNDGNGVTIDGPGVGVAEVGVSIPANLVEANAWISGNQIGVSADGLSPLGNLGSGVALRAGAQLNLIGGWEPSSRNTISANGGDGIHVSGTSSLISRLVVGDAGSNGPYSVVAATPAWGALGTDYLTLTQTIETTSAAGTATYQSTARVLRDPFVPAAMSPLKTQYNFVRGNVIGVDGSGMGGLGNGGSGITVDQGAAFTGIGFVVRPNPATGADELVGAANLISANGAQGILVRGLKTFAPSGVILDDGGNPIDPDTVYTVIQGNLIGLAADGVTPLGNAGSGVVITEGARGNSVGTASFNEAWRAAGPGPGGITFDQAFRNVISGNLGHGVEVSGTDRDPASLADPLSWYDGITLRNFVSGNYIGVNAAGNQAVGNAGSGVVVRHGARSNGIGGFSTLQTPSAGNLIGGNGQHGILVENTRQAPQLLPLPGPMVLEYQIANHNAIAGNLIGVNAAGDRLANGGDGIALINASGEEVGSLVLEGGNIISGNEGNGVRVSGPRSSKNLIIGNYVGTNPLAVPELHSQPDLAAAPLGNDLTGIKLEAGAHDNRLTALISTAKANYNLGNLLLSGMIALDSYQSLRARFFAESVAIPGVIDPFGFEIVAVPGGFQLVTAPVPFRVMASRNVVEGASDSGIMATGTGTTANRVQSAFVGTNRAGELLLAVDGAPLNANKGIGIALSDEATGNILGAENSDLLFRSNRAHIAPSGLAVHLSFDPADVVYLEVDASQRRQVEGNLIVAGNGTASNPWSLPADPSADNFAGGPYFITEGQSLVPRGSATPDSLGPIAFAWDLSGDLDFDDAVGENPVLSWAELVALGVTDGPQSRDIWLRVTDAHGDTGYRATTLRLENAPPQLPPVPVTPAEVVRGQTYWLTLAASDPSAADQLAGFTFEIDWNGDSLWDETVIGPSGTVVSHAFADTGTSTIHVRATDVDGGASAVQARTISVLPWAVIGDAGTGLRDLVWGGTTGADFLIVYSVGSSAVRVDAVVGETIVSTPIADVTGKIAIFGQAGADILVGLGVSERLAIDGGADADELFLIGTSGAATLVGGAGDDKFHLVGTTSSATLFGDEGSDEFNLVSASAGVVSFHGGAGNDMLAITGGSNAMTLSLYGDAGDDTLYVGDSSLTVGVLLNGGDGDDIILGGSGADRIEGGNGNDLVFASIHPTSGPDTIHGGAGDDMIIRAVAGAMVVGGAVLDGGSGHDLIVAGRVGFYDVQASITAIFFGEWLSARPLTEKIAHVTGTPGGDNGSEFLIPGLSVLDDSAVDMIMAGPDADLILCFFDSDITPDLVSGVDVGLDLES